MTRLQKFMYGRYGIDQLYKFLLIIYLILLTINIFLNSKIILYFETLILIVIIFRFFSKNRSQRAKENNLYLDIKNKFNHLFLDQKRSHQLHKNNIFKKCPYCKTILKLPLPKKRGLNYAKCPNCHKRVTILTLKKQKIEIIKTKK